MNILGWREMVALPDLGVDAVKAKIDSGRRSSLLHVASLQSFQRAQQEWLRFAVRPDPTRADIIVSAARLKSTTSSADGERLHIETLLAVGERTYPLEIILTTAEPADFALIIGRSGIKRDDVIDPNRSYLLRGH
jgi:hypothetical protein